MSDGGKGSKPRPIPDYQAYSTNWDTIFSKAPRTPCVGICELVVPWGICRGCGRTAVELEAWRGMSDKERDQAMLECEARLAVLLFQPERLNNKGQNNA